MTEFEMIYRNYDYFMLTKFRGGSDAIWIKLCKFILNNFLVLNGHVCKKC